MTSIFRDGMLVESGGTRAQLLAQERLGRWQAMSFPGQHLTLADSDMSPLGGELLAEGVDLVIGPKSKEPLVASAMWESLSQKGYFVSCILKPQAEVDAMHEAARLLTFARVPAEFEPYYLGRDSREKTVLVDFDSSDCPRAVSRSPLIEQDQYMSSIFDTLQSGLRESLGVRYDTRTNLLLRQTFRDDDEENEYISTEPSNDERERFMGLMKRKRVCVMQFLGPETGLLTLIPKGGGNEIDVVAAPNRLVIFLTENFNYSHICESGATLALQCWFLARAPQFSLQDIGGDMEVLAKIEPGPFAPSGETTAVTGMGIYLGGDSKDPVCMWLAVNKAGADSFVEFPITRWDKDLYVESNDMQRAMAEGKSYTRHQGFVDGIEFFDCQFFGISPSEAKSMDPNQRKCMESTFLALNGAGFTMKQLKSSSTNIGCFIGTSGCEWGSIPHDSDSVGCGQHEAILSNRLNFSLNLKGPSITMNTACSSGLVALHAGKLHLKYKDFDPLLGVVGGGLNFAYSPWAFVGCCAGGMLSFKGRSFTFDLGADGYGRGEGCAMLFLAIEPLSDNCYGLMAGSQTNQDGRSASITAPNGPSQEKCINAALREAQMSPMEVDCFECHGTGTALGDPIEVGAFRRIYNAHKRSHTLAVTTSKTNYGHAEGGAGAVGFIKCLLQVMRAEASPNLHLREFNGHIDHEAFPAQFLTEAGPMHFDTAYSGVSSFGFGGTNSHGMAYGKNTRTSRSKGRAIDYRRTIMDRIETSPCTEIIRPSADPEEWETTGMPISGVTKPKMFQVEVNDDGKTIWREVVSEAPRSLGKSFHLSGTFNNWGVTVMQEDGEVKGLFCADVTIGDFGEELFHIVVDGVPDLLIYPSEAQCPSKISPILGPELPVGDMKDCSWYISGNPGATLNIQFFRSASTKTISWLRI